MLVACKSFGQRLLQAKIIKKWEIPMHITIKFDDTDPSLDKITIFNLILLRYSAYADAHHGARKILFSTSKASNPKLLVMLLHLISNVNFNFNDLKVMILMSMIKNCIKLSTKTGRKQ